MSALALRLWIIAVIGVYIDVGLELLHLFGVIG